jgi:uncharacterized protein
VSETLLRVSVVLASPGNARLVEVELPVGATLRDAVAVSGLVSQGELDSDSLIAGVFSHVRPLDAPLRDGDRVEIYRPMTIDPKEARRVRAAIRRKRRKL